MTSPPPLPKMPPRRVRAEGNRPETRSVGGSEMAKKMTKSEIVTHIAEKTGLSRKLVTAVK